MTEKSLTAAAVSLGSRAADISTALYSIQDDCGDESNSDIVSVATELTLLSTTLWRLHEAMIAEPASYTESFNQDLAEIANELKMVFDEIDECYTELRRMDKRSHNSVVWLFKKRRAHHLQKHLEALKTTLTVMRTVLWHGKDYGTQKYTFTSLLLRNFRFIP